MTGEGKTFNQALHDFVISDDNHGQYGQLITERAAENFSQGWLIVMEKASIRPRLQGIVNRFKPGAAPDLPTNSWFRRTTIQDVLDKLNKKCHFPSCKRVNFHKLPNAMIAMYVYGIIEHLRQSPDFFGTNTGPPLKGDADPYYALELVAKKFESDGQTHIEETYLENRMKPMDIDRSFCTFFGSS